MKKIFFLTILTSLFCISCKKDPPINASQQTDKIVPGQVQFTINNNVTLKQSMNAIKGLGVTKYVIYDFYYTKTIPNDSMTYYWQIFKNCNYITAFSVSRRPNESFTNFSAFNFLNLDSVKYSNWDSIVNKLQLIEMPNGSDGYNRYGYFSVPNGQEKIWIDKLRSLPIISNAGYEYYFNLEHF